MVTKEWGRDRIVAALKENTFGYQNISLPYGLETGGVNRSPAAELIFKEKLDGKSVFDLGCNHGYFCFFAEEHGATRVLGVDISSEHLRKARLLAEMRGSKATFERFDIEAGAIPGQFDYVLCLNVLHHLRNPLAALEKLIAATRES